MNEYETVYVEENGATFAEAVNAQRVWDECKAGILHMRWVRKRT